MIEGIVLERNEGRPLARTRVSLQVVSGTSAGPTQQTTADAFGRFAFPKLPAGAYLLSAERPGYAPAFYGQTRWNGPGAPIVLEAESRLAAQIQLGKLGVLTGEVTDENRVGIPSYPVLAYRHGRPLRLAGHGITDDRGVFRIAGLEPGSYHVRTGPKQLEDGSQFLPTWFGRTASVEDSQAVEVQLDEETSEISIMPLPGKLLRLAGRVAWPAVAPVALYSDLGKVTAGVAGDGRFVFDQLSPGSYEIITESNGGKSPLASYRKFWLGEDTEGLVLEPSPASRLFFYCSTSDNRPFDRRQTALILRRTAPPGESGTRRVTCQEMEDLLLSPGAWQATVVAPVRFSVDSLEFGGKPVPAAELTVVPGQRSELVLHLSSKPGTLRGRVLGADGQPAIGAVVLLHTPDESLRWRIAGRNVARAGDKGEFRLEGLPPGSYRVLATFEYQKPEDFDWTAVDGVTVLLGEGEQTQVNLQL